MFKSGCWSDCRFSTSLGTLSPPLVIQALTDLGALRSQIESFQATQGKLESELTTIHGTLETGIVTTQGKIETAIGEMARGLQQAFVSSQSRLEAEIKALKTQAQARRDLENELRAATKNIETVLTGSGTRGSAGEHILSNSLKIFPPGMIETNFKVNGKLCEFAMILPNGKRLAIDSKFPSMRNGEGRLVEKLIANRIREVAQYISSDTTLPFAIAALPDSLIHPVRRST